MEYWKARLQLDHWDISCAYGTQEDLRADKDEFLYATVLMNPVRHSARILVFKWRDIVRAETHLGVPLIGGESPDVIYEKAVIHELLHIRLDPRERVASDTAFETGLDILAELLCKMRNRG